MVRRTYPGESVAELSVGRSFGYRTIFGRDMGVHDLRVSSRLRWMVAVLGVVAAVAVAGPDGAVVSARVSATGAHGQTGQPVLLPCRITAANTAVWSHQNASGVVLYYGHVIMDTEGCGLSPAQVAATFRPMTGQPTTCDARGTLQNDSAVCTSAIGAAVPGTHIVVEASGNTEGEGGADAFASSCTIIIPHLSTISCRFPLEFP